MDSNLESVWYGAPSAPKTMSAPEPQHEDERHVRLRTDARYFLLLSLALGAVFALLFVNAYALGLNAALLAAAMALCNDAALTDGGAQGEPTEADLALVRAHEMHDQVAQCTCKEAYDVQGDGAYTIAVLDFGLKRGILRALLSRGCTLRVFPADTDAQTILDSGCDGVMLTNGPGDPQDNPKAIKTIRELMGKKPMFGICLGHQLMALAMGGRTVQMKYGHHGANHPVKDLARGTCSVTAQNHGFMVDPDQLPAGAVVSHLNWNDQTVEGVRYTDKNAFSVQFHPEACGGPCETAYLFDDFIAMIKANNVQ